MSANVLLWADNRRISLVDGEGQLDIIGQDAKLLQFYCETCDKDLESEEFDFVVCPTTDKKVNLRKQENLLMIQIP